jgi:hypothetical protein
LKKTLEVLLFFVVGMVFVVVAIAAWNFFTSFRIRP